MAKSSSRFTKTANINASIENKTWETMQEQDRWEDRVQ